MNSYCMQHIMQFLFPSRDRHACAQKSRHEAHTADMFAYKDAPVCTVGCGVHFNGGGGVGGGGACGVVLKPPCYVLEIIFMSHVFKTTSTFHVRRNI